MSGYFAVACDPCLVGRVAGNAVDRNDVTLAVQRLCQPLGRLHRPGLLVDTDIDRILRRHFGIGCNHQHIACLCLSKDRIERSRAAGVDQNGIDTLIDKIPDVANLALNVDIAALHDDLDLHTLICPCFRSGLRFLDHLCAPLAADETVRQADLEALFLSRSGRDDADAGQHGQDKFLKHWKTPPPRQPM
jgi:hypothetical protein